MRTLSVNETMDISGGMGGMDLPNIDILGLLGAGAAATFTIGAIVGIGIAYYCYNNQ